MRFDETILKGAIKCRSAKSIGKLQERYGYSKDQAAQAVNEHLKELERETDKTRQV